MIREIRRDQVRPGMFIKGFGGSFFDHPFWKTKFVLTSAEDLEKIQLCSAPYVLIDESKGLRLEEPLPVVEKAPPPPSPSPPRTASALPLGTSSKQEAIRLINEGKSSVKAMLKDLRLGKAVQIASVNRLVDDISKAVENQPRTLLDIVRLKKKDEYTYMHSVAVCTLMVNLAQFLGKSEKEIREYGQAGLLHDVGKIGIPDAVLNKPGRLTDEEFVTVRQHPGHGYQLLKDSAGVCALALDVVLHHHEKIDGSGYPAGLKGEALTEAMRMGAICDVYDALTSNRIYKEGWAPAQAVAAMWSWEGHFDRDLLFAFMKSIGFFPEGMLVQLRSNRLGLVKPARRKDDGPRIVAFYSTREHELIKPEELMLGGSLAGDSVVALAHAERWGIPDWDKLKDRLLQAA